MTVSKIPCVRTPNVALMSAIFCALAIPFSVSGTAAAKDAGATTILRTVSIPSTAISNQNEFLKAVMKEFYGTFSQRGGCWTTKRADVTYCMKPYKMDIVGFDNNRRLFIVIAGQTLDGDGTPQDYRTTSSPTAEHSARRHGT
jgi:hypothetical protein